MKKNRNECDKGTTLAGGGRGRWTVKERVDV